MADIATFQHLVGKKFVADDVQPKADEFKAADLPPRTRVLPPGSMVTMDWVENRLNVDLNDHKVCTAVRFG